MPSRRTLLLAPLGVAVVGGTAFGVMLHRMKQGDFNPREVPNPLVGQPAPAMALPGLDAGPGISRADLADGRPILINFFASWCQPCHVEHPSLMALSQGGLRVWGIVYKDKADAARSFLARLGNPYARVATDEAGQVAIDWGITGVPESFLLDGTGVVRWRYPGPLLPDVVTDRLRPALRAIV